MLSRHSLKRRGSSSPNSSASISGTSWVEEGCGGGWLELTSQTSAASQIKRYLEMRNMSLRDRMAACCLMSRRSSASPFRMRSLQTSAFSEGQAAARPDRMRG